MKSEVKIPLLRGVQPLVSIKPDEDYWCYFIEDKDSCSCEPWGGRGAIWSTLITKEETDGA